MLLTPFAINIKIPSHKKIFVNTLSEVRVLVVSTGLGYRYISLPHFVSIFRSLSELKISIPCEIDRDVRTNFATNMEIWLQNVNKLCRTKLLLKGLGYKGNLSENKSVLNLKLGYSHAISLGIPRDKIKVKIVKNVITVKGHDFINTGNFARKIRCLREPDAYKGKGVWYKNENRVFKELKKK